MALPPPIRGFRSKHINALIRACLANTPLAGIGVSVRRTPNGTVINAESGGDAEAIPVAWTVRAKRVDEDPATGEKKTVWELYSPCVFAGTMEIYPAGGSAFEWVELEDDIAGGGKRLYAIVRSAGSSSEDGAASGGVGGETPNVRLSNQLEPGATAAVLIGRWLNNSKDDIETWEQNHVGVIVCPAFSAGIEGLCLGPIEQYSEGEGMEPKFAQFAGHLELNAENTAFDFVHAVDENGEEYPPLFTWPRRQIVYRMVNESGSSSGTEGIGYAFGPDLGGEEPTFWLGKHSVSTATALTYTPPADETGEGSLSGGGVSFSFLGSSPSDEGKVVFLQTVVEDANAITTYEDSSGEAAEGGSSGGPTS